MNDKAPNSAQASEHERALVEAALREASAPSKPSQGHPPSVRARLGGSPFTLPPEGTFPGYDLLRELHRGGQGVVYQAIQKATRRKVAIKVMRDGPFASQREHARFEREAQILGQLNHPGIVSIHDSGQTHQGLSFFVMDYISGTPLDTYMAGTQPGAGSNINDALRMLVEVCEGVSAAHLKGIIHRDLKPGNIIVDGEGHPHILDFGLAKVAGGDTTGGEGVAGQPLQLMTITGQFLGSMPWASPEQAEGRSEKIDVRTDVYSLGVILYQALTGRFPYEVVGNMREVLENILTIEPEPPRKLRRQIPEDVERIVLKCLQKDRDRRYQSAAELVRDIHHYLNGEPIEARRDSVTYVVSMHLRRHKLAVAIIVPFILAAAVGSVTSAVMWRRAVREKAEATVLNHFLETALHVNPDISRDKEWTVHQMIDDAAKRLDQGEFETQPAINANAHALVGMTYLENGDAPSSEKHLRTALTLKENLYGQNDLGVAELRASLGRALIQQARLDDAERYLGQARAVQERLLSADDKALALTLNGIAVVKQHSEHYADAERLFERVITIDTNNNDRRGLAAANFNMAVLKDDQKLWKDAEPYYAKSLEIYRQIKPKDGRDPDIAFVQAGYGWNLVEQGRPCDAVPRLDESWAIRSKILQDTDWKRAWTQSCLGESLARCKAAERANEAESLLTQSCLSLHDNPKAPQMSKQLARDRVIDFYESQGNTAKAAEYRARAPGR